MNAYLYAIRENATEEQLAEIDAALEPPVTYRHKGAPVWYGSDDDAWAEFARQART